MSRNWTEHTSQAPSKHKMLQEKHLTNPYNEKTSREYHITREHFTVVFTQCFKTCFSLATMRLFLTNLWSVAMTWQKILALSILLYFTGFNKPVGIICHLDNDFHQQFFFPKSSVAFWISKVLKPSKKPSITYTEVILDSMWGLQFNRNYVKCQIW